MNWHDKMMEDVFKMEHPIARKITELHEQAKFLSIGDTEKFLKQWQQDNPEQGREIAEFIIAKENEYRESRREVKSKLGYSRIGLGNV